MATAHIVSINVVLKRDQKIYYMPGTEMILACCLLCQEQFLLCYPTTLFPYYVAMPPPPPSL